MSSTRKKMFKKQELIFQVRHSNLNIKNISTIQLNKNNAPERAWRVKCQPRVFVAPKTAGLLLSSSISIVETSQHSSQCYCIILLYIIILCMASTITGSKTFRIDFQQNYYIIQNNLGTNEESQQRAVYLCDYLSYL